MLKKASVDDNLCLQTTKIKQTEDNTKLLLSAKTPKSIKTLPEVL